MIHLSIDLKVLLVATIIGLIVYRKKDPLYLKLLPFLLLLTLLVEITAELFQGPGGNNSLLMNIFTVIELLYYLYFFNRVIPNKKVKKITRMLYFLLPLACLINIFFIQGIYVFHTYTYTLGCLIMICLGITYFYQLFSGEGYVNLLREPSFWISIGIIFFFVSSVSLVSVFNYVSTLPPKVIIFLQKCLFAVNAFFYCLLIIALLCKKTIRNSSSSS